MAVGRQGTASMEWTNRTGHGSEGGVYHWATKVVAVVGTDVVAVATMASAAGIAGTAWGEGEDPVRR